MVAAGYAHTECIGERAPLCEVSSEMCEPSKSVGTSFPLYEHCVLWFFLSKYVEWLDTLFLFVAGKHVGFLHRFHHLGAPMATGLLWWSGAEFAWIFLLLNGAVHTVMYGYYTACLLKINLRHLRPWITRMQIAQFVTGFSLLGALYPIDHMTPQNKAAFFRYGYVGIVLWLFLHFYWSQYVISHKATKTS